MKALETDFKRVWVDIDNGYLPDERYIARCLSTHNVAKYDVWSTAKGFHLQFLFNDAISGYDALELLLALGCDQLYVLRWLKKADFTLFATRRGVENEEFLYSKWFNP